MSLLDHSRPSIGYKVRRRGMLQVASQPGRKITVIARPMTINDATWLRDALDEAIENAGRKPPEAEELPL